MAKSRKSKGRSKRSRRATGGRKRVSRKPKKTIGSRSARGLMPPASDVSAVRTPSTIASNMSLTQLQNAAAARGIPFGGLNKDALVQRINKYA